MENADKLEELIRKDFDYMSGLKKSINSLKHKINQETDELNVLLKEDREYIDMITSLNTGKGKYYAISMLPYDIDSMIKNSKDFSKEEIETLKVKYQLAVEAENRLKERYEYLKSTVKERTTSIKEHKKSIANNKKKLLQRQKEHDLRRVEVKNKDKKLQKLQNKKQDN